MGKAARRNSPILNAFVYLKTQIMRLLTTLLLCLPLFLPAQDAYHTALLNQLQQDHTLSGGTWLLPPSEQTLLAQATQYGCTRQDLTAAAQPFSQVIQLTIPAAGNNPWDAGFIHSSQQAIQSGARVLLTVWLRTTAAPAEVTLFAEDAVSYEKEVYLSLELDTAWQQIFIPFEAGKAYAAGDLNLGFHLAYLAQTVEIAGMNALNYGSSFALDDLPVQFPVTYPGQEADAPWRAAAATRIALHRQATLDLTLEDNQGQPLANTPVRVQMLRHQFGFGTAFTPRRLAGNFQNNPTYTQHLLDLDGQGHGFNLVVPENALKWRAWEQGWAGSQTETLNALQWLHDRQIAVRGHVLLWPGWSYLPDDMQANSQNVTYLENRIANHLDDILNQAGVRSVVREWDVVNEIAHVRDLEYALAGQGNYVTGREIYAEVLQQAKQQDPGLTTYLNDYDILSNGSLQGNSYLQFKQFIQEAIDEGGEVDGIGFQAHMGTRLVAPDSLYAILEDCYQTFGKPLKITEYDLPKELPDDAEAQYLHDFLTLVFSHPAVDGFLMWGFWDGAHWKGNAPLYYEDWTPKPAHATFVDLLFDQWWTDTTLMTDAQGSLDLRGFKGDYRIEATDLGLAREISLSQDSDTTLTLFILSQDQPEEGLLIFPQPARASVQVAFPFADQWTLHLFDATGRQVYQAQVNGKTTRVSLADLPAGIYGLRLANGRQAFAQKLIKE